MTGGSRNAPVGISQPAGGGRRKIVDEHLATLAALLDEATFGYLERLGVAAGWRCWEAGAGAGTVAQWLAGRTGAAGHVLATDIDISRLTAGHQAAFAVRRHDLAAEPAPGGGFDLVHARLVLEHLPDPAAALTAMAGALRPGGWLLAESADPMLQPLACPDEHGPAQVLANKVRHASGPPIRGVATSGSAAACPGCCATRRRSPASRPRPASRWPARAPHGSSASWSCAAAIRCSLSGCSPAARSTSS